MSGIALHDRRHSDERLAIVETKLGDHLATCVAAHEGVDKRLCRIEKGILAAWGTGTVMGIAVLGFLIKIALHLG